ncbi:2Fe-2S iron-sulfur cluster-binding protein [Marinigracilibium pacificum]|uniref:(2Fe-2S)-binding protein n=1 Tax=Marinigracilibium pacificum TaxID=2729599 RepID=A0A848J9R6_9BACT|nr:2Fe-2S iron-sulfur cluster-binding protein [Marinigracilibium pacificum]NMM49782.1 (2Fe-2S)-binding protein [Marinigracilibium pacificum]
MENKIVVINHNNKSIRFLDSGNTFLELFKKEKVPWMNICGGKGKCTTCRMKVISGMENISPETEIEKRSHNLNRLHENERLACQSFPCGGKIEVSTSQDYKFPHITYSDD